MVRRVKGNVFAFLTDLFKINYYAYYLLDQAFGEVAGGIMRAGSYVPRSALMGQQLEEGYGKYSRGQINNTSNGRKLGKKE